MRRALWVLAAGAAILGWADGSRGQFPSSSAGDPFFLYYGWYLPQQAALANQPRIQDTIQANVAQNQAYATTNRSNLYDPNGGYGRFNPHAPEPELGAGAGASGRGTIGLRMRSTVPTSNANGQGPSLYFNRTAQHYPSARVGQGPNRNLAVAGRGVRRSANMPSMPSMPGPR
ncbi:MAG TPA: hypothetical protein VGH33_20200 [Isosphaeraceae bacterium]|jgi:hypothetical protein